MDLVFSCLRLNKEFNCVILCSNATVEVFEAFKNGYEYVYSLFIDVNDFENGAYA